MRNNSENPKTKVQTKEFTISTKGENTMRKVKSIPCVAILAMLLSITTSCDFANPSALAGQWLKESDGMPMELFKDGTGVLGVNNIPISWAVEDKRFVMVFLGATNVFDYKISGSKLILGEATYIRKAEYEKFKKQKEEEAKKEAAKKEEEEAKKAEAERKELEKISSYFTDSRDGNKYRSVKIGTQTWMAENLNYAGKNDNIGVCYDNKPENCKKYGALYTWDEANKVCPPGWHLPSKKEWDVLIDFAGGDKIAGKKLKAKSGWKEHKCKYTTEETTGRGNVIVTEHDKCATNEFGFSALPGGSRWWSSSEYNEVSGGFNAYSLSMLYDNECAAWDFNDKSIGVSVRCLKGESNDVRYDSDIEDKETAKASANSFTDSRDSKTYKTVNIGTQTWMAENLNYDAKGSVCYDNKPANCEKYGRLYDWNIAMKSCPSGWHLPANTEWDKLYRHADGTSETDSPYESKTAGKYLKTVNGWNNGGNGTDDYDFAALPGGNYYNGSFTGADDYGYWWSASEGSSKVAHRRSILYSDDHAYWRSGSKSYLLSVRCVKD